MKTYTISGAESSTHVPQHPDRTGYRCAGGGMNFDLVFKVWPSRGAMLTTIRMQGKRAPHHLDWKDWQETIGKRMAAKAQASQGVL